MDRKELYGETDRQTTQPTTYGTTGGTTQSTTGGRTQGMGTGDQTPQSTDEMVNQAQQMAGQVLDEAQQRAKSMLVEQKERAASNIGDVADAMRQTSQTLKQHDETSAMMAQFVDKAAQQVDQLAGYLRNRNVDEIVNDAESFARREPALFVGGAMAVGLLFARFLKASSDRGAAARRNRYPITQYQSTYSPDMAATRRADWEYTPGFAEAGTAYRGRYGVGTEGDFAPDYDETTM